MGIFFPHYVYLKNKLWNPAVVAWIIALPSWEAAILAAYSTANLNTRSTESEEWRFAIWWIINAEAL